MSKEHPEVVWCVDFLLDTTMWNEGFDNADLPWCRFYTDDDTFVSNLVTNIHIPVEGKPFQGNFNIKSFQTVMKDDDESGTYLLELKNDEFSEDELEYEDDRYLGFLSASDDILEKVLSRLERWQGI